jgi:succinylarginine dihydrolase
LPRVDTTFKTIREKFAASKAVHKVELADDIDKAKNLAKPVANRVHVVLFEVNQEVVNQDPLLDRTLFNRLQTRVQTQNNGLHEATFKNDTLCVIS